MRQRSRKLVGTFLIFVLVVIYAVLATTVATVFLGSAHWFVQMLYFLFTGILWVVPAMVIIKWMMRPDRDQETGYEAG